jgi:hypothetical protein
MVAKRLVRPSRLSTYLYIYCKAKGRLIVSLQGIHEALYTYNLGPK